MNLRKLLIIMSLILLVAAPPWVAAEPAPQKVKVDTVLKARGKVTQAEMKAAAKNFKAKTLKAGVSFAAPAVLNPGGIPHYFGPYGNWAYSPLPRGPIGVITVTNGGTGYTHPIVTIEDYYSSSVTGASAASATVDPVTGAITGITGGLGGTNYSAPTVTIVDDPSQCGGPAQPECGEDAAASATITPVAGTGMRKFIDKMPGLTPAGANTLVTTNRLGAGGPATTDGQYIPVAVADSATFPGSDYYEIALVEFFEKMHTDVPPTKQRGYVQLETPAVLAAMAAQVPPLVTKHVDVGGGHFAIDYPHYLGPAIVARGSALGVAGAPGQPVPVRLKFYNLLPTGTGGNLFLPVDASIMGSAEGPLVGEMYTENRANIHLHGNNTAWISDGTPHQWITPAGESTVYPKGVSVRNVPDMWFDPVTHTPVPAGTPGATNDPGDGSVTLFYTNAHSARLLFYHDHALGITRLNVYAGEAAGYVITDQVDQDMINGTNLSGVNNLPSSTPLVPPQTNAKVLPGLGTPLVIQDRTFVDAALIAAQDPTWNWGTIPGTPVTGDLWYPHVYMSAQNPEDPSGMNAFGRWHYGPWFIQPTPECDSSGLPVGCIDVGPVPNPYCAPTPPTVCNVNGTYDPGVEGIDYDCSASPGEPACMPGVPNPSMPGEAFMDTPVVNGTAYPYMEVEPKAYRFRILNAANDRFLNLQLYVAADKTLPTTAGTDYTITPARLCDGVSGAAVSDCTEVKMVPVSVDPANQYADWPSGIPDPLTKGPNWIQIGTEGGFMPKPVVIPQKPIGWNLNATTFNFGVVNQHSLLLGSAERADVVVDFSLYAGKTLILYNDAPAAFPAGVSTYDYYTGVADQMDIGGAPTTLPGYGPNTRTVMQIRVGTTVTPGTETTDVTPANLNAVFAKGAAKRGVFEASQEPIIIPQKAYESAYNVTNFPGGTAVQYVNIAATQKTFAPINADGVLQPNVTIPLEMKAMHDEMGGVYDTQFGRMAGMLGLASLSSPIHVLLPYGYASPPVEIIKGSVTGSQIGVLPDGTQLWRIFHNGVDTHTIHTHLFTSQLINRLGQDGSLLPPDPIELGWKDTFRINPLEVTFLALRPVIPTPEQLPFQVPNSVRLIDPTLPEGAPLFAPAPAGWFSPDGANIPEILNHYVNFGWEYVWHCHILAHEEMDMMHGIAFALPPVAPTGLTAGVTGSGASQSVVLNWTDASLNETSFTVQRADNPGFTPPLTTFSVGPNVSTYADLVGITVQSFYYRVFASNTVGDTVTPGFPTTTMDSGFSNVVHPITAFPVAGVSPTTLTFAGQFVNTTSSAQLVTLSNTGSLPLTITGITLGGTNPGDFARTTTCLATLAAGANCTISVTFTPTTMGTRTAGLTISSNDPANPTLAVTLNGTGIAPIAGVSPTSLTFAGRLVNTTSAAQTVTLLNAGTAPLTINSIGLTGANPSNFARTTTCGATLAAGANCTISVTFTPTATGARAASLTISTNDPAHLTLTVTLSGTGIAPIAGVSPGTLAFSSPLNVTTAAQTVTVSNTGTAPLVINSLAFGGTNPTMFARSSTCPIGGAGLAAGGNCTINVTFTPTSVGAKSATLNVNVAAPATSQSVSLTGTVLAPIATVSPATQAFSSPLNVTTAAKTVTLSNTGTAPLTINGIALGGTNSTEFARTTTCGASLAAGASCTINITFRPTSIGTGTKSATLNVNVAAPATSQSVALTGTVQAPILSLSPASLAFSSPLNVTTAAKTVTVSNTGFAPLVINSLAFGGTNPTMFARSNTCPIGGAGLASGGSCTINITFRPTSTGTKSATLSVNVAGPATSQSVALTGTVLAPVLSLSPTSLSFGNVTRGSTSNARTVTVSNTGGAPLIINSVAFGGTNGNQFTRSNNCPIGGAGLAAGGSCTINVRFSPTAGTPRGAKTATLNVTVAAPATSGAVALSGTAQ